MSDDEELLYGLLGTQFNTDADEQTEFKRSKLKRKAAEDEIVDAKGRATRFHGAFTGGFSAGYFNTVGSKEGFQPTDFVSQGKTTVRNYRLTKPEDFMDDEDFNENGIAPKLLRTKSIFDNEDIRNHMKKNLGSHDIVGDSDIIKDILIPQSVTIGLVLLRKLGYLASRGVGENNFANSSINEDEEISVTKKFDYEAEEVFQLIPKTDRFGLGYSGMNRDLISFKTAIDNRGVNFGLKNKKGIRGVAFGGVDEDDDDCDLKDIYGRDSMSKYNYEYIDEEKDTNFGWTAPKHNLKNAILPSDSIPGFQIATQSKKALRINYEPPNPPRFFLPIYPIRREKENSELKKRGERPKLMPNEDIGSVFNLLSSDDKNRLLTMGKGSGKKKGVSRWGEVSQVVGKEDNREIIANLTTIRNESNKSGLEIRSLESPMELFPRKDFRKSLGMISSLSAKFKSAGSSSTTNIASSLQSPIAGKVIENELELSSKELAANNETYGFMTRTVLEWHPDKLMCKRFNVPDPFPGTKFVGVPDDIGNIEETKRNFEEYHAKRSLELSSVPIEPILESCQSIVDDNSKELEKSPEKEDSPSVMIKTTVPDLSDKPSIDLFKAVFDDSEAEFSSSDDDDDNDNEVKTSVVVEEPKTLAPVSILSSMEEALGAMFGGGVNKLPAVTEIKKPQIVSTNPIEKPRIFGPTPPPGFIYNPVIPDSSPLYNINDIISKNIPKTHNEAVDSETYVYKEKSKSKKNKHEKKSKKSKSHKKNKNKKKSKKKKSSSSQSESSH